MNSTPSGSPPGPDHTVDGGNGHAPGAPGRSDLTPAAASAAPPRDRYREWRLPSTESSVTVLRRRLHAFLQATPLSAEELYDLLLAACEAAGNAIEHAQNPREPFFDVLTDFDGARVRVVVCDHGEWRDGIAGVHRGRGLRMMRVLADTSVVTGPTGTTVTLCSPRAVTRPNGDGGPHGGADGAGRLPPEPFCA